MKNLAFALLLATGGLSLATVATSPADASRATAAMACCDDPPPPCWPTGQCDDTKKPDGGSNRGSQQR
jgi:hypothetical protein